MRIVVDAMGSDAYPGPDVAGAVMAAREFGEEIILVGDKGRIRKELEQHDTASLSIHVEHASEVIEMTDKPRIACRIKKDSSMHVGLGLVKEGQADAYVSAGNTGGIYAVARLYTLKKIAGIRRPALGVILPIDERPMIIDNGANADCSPKDLVQFGMMGSLYVERVRGIENPKVAILSNGEEDIKGNKLVKETIPLLADSGLNFIGNIEPKEFMKGYADVTVTDGFTGNLVIKSIEAIASYMSNVIRDEMTRGPRTILGGLLARPAFARVRKKLDPGEVGGVPLLGVNGIVIIGHGRSNAYAIKQAVGQARLAVQQDIVGAIRDGLAA